MEPKDPPGESDEKPADRATNLAARVADGSAIDWTGGQSGKPDEIDPATVEQLKAISAIADLRRAIADEPANAGTRSWGSLTIVGRIGAGQFGEVFRAWDTRLHRQVALKMLRPPASSDPANERRAIEEARHLARVRHPNVLTVYGADQIGDAAGIWTELIEGKTLELLLTEQGPLSQE